MRVPVLVGIGLFIAGTASAQDAITATVTLKGKDGTNHGTVTLTDTFSGVLLRAELKGLPPGPHGFHFHEKGVCAPDFAAAGGHFNPDEGKHGYLSEEGPHAGDLPNLMVPESGNVA